MMLEELVKRLRNLSGTDNIAEFDEAANAIEELLQIRDRQRNVLMRYGGETGIQQIVDINRSLSKRIDERLPRWIPVAEKLIYSGWYLVACNEWGGSAVRKAIYDMATRRWLEFPCGGPKDITKFVTHYMPLPEPPKEET